MQALEAASEEPYYRVNQSNGQSSEAFHSLLGELEQFVQAFELAIGLRGAGRWCGERLHEAVRAGRATVEQHLSGQYFSAYTLETDTAHILLENYELARVHAGLIKRAYQCYTFTVLRFLLTRLAHEDTHAHLFKTAYGDLFAELRDKSQRRHDEVKPSPREKIKRLPLELTAPLYLKEREELAARRMQRFALNAFLKEQYVHEPDRYGLLGVPLFLPPHTEVCREIERQTNGMVEFRNGYLSTYRHILEEYVGALETPPEEMREEARRYLHTRAGELITLAQECLAGDYHGLRVREHELIWRPGRGQKL
jgi:hypothetical protein